MSILEAKILNVRTGKVLSETEQSVFLGQLKLFEQTYISEYTEKHKKLLIEYLVALVANVRDGTLPKNFLSQFKENNESVTKFGFLAFENRDLGMTGWEYLLKIANGKLSSGK